jgi:hypothetical protein
MTECKNKTILRGDFSHPLDNQSNIFDKKYRITSVFGVRLDPIHGREKIFHNGVDYASPSNSPVYATYSGRVSRVAWDMNNEDRGYGNWVEIEHPLANGESIYTRYGHLGVSQKDPRISVKVGDQVVKGQEIAKSGKTGGAKGYHLHYDVRKGRSGHYGSPTTETRFDPLNDVRYDPNLSQLEITNYEDYVKNYISNKKQEIPEDINDQTMSDQEINQLANQIDEENKSKVRQSIINHTSYAAINSCFDSNLESKNVKEQFKQELIKIKQNIITDIAKSKTELDDLEDQALSSCIDLNHLEETANAKTLTRDKIKHRFGIVKEAVSHKLDQDLNRLRQQCCGINFMSGELKMMTKSGHHIEKKMANYLPGIAIGRDQEMLMAVDVWLNPAITNNIV